MVVFGLKYYAEMRSKYQGITWRFDIAQRGYTGPSEEMTFSGVSPIKITWERRGDDFYTPVKAYGFTDRARWHFMAFYGILGKRKLPQKLPQNLRVRESD